MGQAITNKDAGLIPEYGPVKFLHIIRKTKEQFIAYIVSNRELLYRVFLERSGENDFEASEVSISYFGEKKFLENMVHDGFEKLQDHMNSLLAKKNVIEGKYKLPVNAYLISQTPL